MSSKPIEPNDQTTPPQPHPSKPDIAGDSSNDESAPDDNSPEILVTIPGTILHLIDPNCSVELAIGDLTVFRLLQNGKAVAAVAAVSDDIQWPLSKDLTAVKLDSSHYFFSFQPPKHVFNGSSSSSSSSSSSDDEDDGKQKLGKSKKTQKEEEEIEILNYGLTIISSGHEESLTDFDSVLECYCNFTVQKVGFVGAQPTTKVESLEELESDQKKKEMVEGQCLVYWTTLAPNVEEYSGIAAKLVAAGSGQLVKGILWCGDVAVERLKWGNEVLRKRIASGNNTEIDPATLKRIKRVKKVTKMTEKVATGVLSGVIKVSGYFTGSVANSKVGKKFFGLLPGEVVLASLDGFSRICDAVEVTGKNVMSTTSTVTTGLVSHRYGEEAAKATCEGFDAAGHAVGTAWAVFKIRQALNPKSVIKPTALAKAAAKSAKKAKKKKGQKASNHWII